MDRRLIRERISRLKRELKEVEQHRELIRTQRKRSNMKVAALVGYTSAGKSSMYSRICTSGGIAGIESAEHGVDTEGQLELSRQDTWRIVAIYVGVIE